VTDGRGSSVFDLLTHRRRTSDSGSSLCQDVVVVRVLGLVLAGPGSGLSEELALGCESVALESVVVPRLPSRARHRMGDGIVEHVSIDDVGESAFDAAHGFHRCFARGFLAVVVGPPFGGVAELDGGHDV
jgi:hypothetical protein